MKFKINTICFILLLFLIIGVASASESDNETLQQTIDEPDMELSQNHLENLDALELSVDKQDNLEAKINNVEKLEAKKKSSTTTKSTAVKKTKVKISAPNVKMYFKDGTNFKITVKDEKNHALNNAKVKIEVEGYAMTAKTNPNGEIFLTVAMNPGKHNVLITFDETSKYTKATEKSTITVKSTIKSNDLTKFYKKPTKYSAKFYNAKGKALKKTSVKFKLNGKSYSVKTNNKGIGSLTVDLKPGIYKITAKNSKTSESTTKTINIKDILETHDLTVNDENSTIYSVKVLDSNGRAVSNKQVTLKVDGKSYTAISNSKGIASKKLDLEVGKYNIITTYNGLHHSNLIIVKQLAKHSPFSHIVSIPSYVNVTTPYVFYNSAYATKTGIDGIIRMPKNELFTIQISETKSYLFVQAPISGVDATVIGYKTHLIPFDGSPIQSAVNKEDLKGDGILIYYTTNYTNIEYRNTAETNYDLFGVYMDRGIENSETITYVQNTQIKAKVNIRTVQYDELGIRYNLAKFYGKSIYDFNYQSYDEITRGNENSVKFANTGEPVTYNYFGRSIVGYPTKEDIMTRFIINGKEELEKPETISYGLGDKYQKTYGFEVLQSYAIINEKITQDIVDNWISKSSGFTSRLGITNVYGMFMASLSTAWMADELANSYSKEYDVNWKRTKTTTILGGMNLNKTYIHILNADMGMDVTGNNETNIGTFKLINSIALPELEKIALNPISDLFSDNITSSLEELSRIHSNYSIIFNDDLAIIQIDSSNTSIIINQSSGVANVIMKDDDFFYKGATINTINDCCSCTQVTRYITTRLVDDSFRLFVTNPLTYPYIKDKGYQLAMMLHKAIGYSIGSAGLVLNGLKGLTYKIFGIAMVMQDIGNTYRSQEDKKDWHYLMDRYPFTRSGPFQQKKVYNIPNKKGGYDYIEAPIKKDFSLDRENTLYISDGKVKKLSKKETYNYYSDDYYSLYTVPPKYWNKN